MIDVRTILAILVIVAAEVHAGTAGAAPAPERKPDIRVVRPADKGASLRRVRVCHRREVRRRDRAQRWHNERIKVCRLEWVAR